MFPPSKLNDYFAIVDDFFHKSFHDDSRLFFAVKTFQSSESYPSSRYFFSKREEDVELAEAARILAGKKSSESATEGASPSSTGNVVFFSPRLQLRDDGSAYGKVKVGCEVQVPHICRVRQNFVVSNDGVVGGNLILKELVKGMVAKGHISINTIAPPSEDVSAVTIDYERNDFYSTVGYQRNGLGSSNLLVDFGTKFFNLLAGAGAERQSLSFLEQQEGLAQVHAMYAGTGFCGENWCVAGKMIRTNDVWTAARIAMYQRMVRSTSVACSYTFDLLDARAHITMGLSQGFVLKVPSFISMPDWTVSDPTASSSNSSSSTTGIPFVCALKADTDGYVSATIRGLISEVGRWGIVAKKNVSVSGSPIKFGVTLSLERD